MKRLVSVLCFIALMAAACGGAAPESSRTQKEAASAKDRKRIAKKPKREADGRAKTGENGESPAKTRNPRKRRNTSANSAETSGTTSNSDAPSRNGGRGNADRGADRSKETANAAAVPIPAGVHEYATEGRRTLSGNAEQFPATTTLSTGRPTSGLQRQVRDLRDRDGHGTVTETRLLYRNHGVFLAYVKVTSSFPGGFTDVREFDLPKPQLVAPTGGKPGFTRAFSMQGSGTRADVAIQARRYETMNVSGSRIRVLVVETTISFSGALEGEQHSVSWFWPKHLWVMREEVETDVRNGPVRLQSDYTATLRNQ